MKERKITLGEFDESTNIEDRFFYGKKDQCEGCEENDEIDTNLILIKQFLLSFEMVMEGKSRLLAQFLKFHGDRYESSQLSKENFAIFQQTLELKQYEKPSRKLYANFGEFLLSIQMKIYELPKVFFEQQLGILWRLASLQIRLLRDFGELERRGPVVLKCQRCQYNKSPNFILRCGHVFCKSCLTKQIILSKVLVSSPTIQIRCPYSPCKYFLSSEEIIVATGGIIGFGNETFSEPKKERLVSSSVYIDREGKTCMVCGASEDLLQTDHKDGIFFTCKICAKSFLKSQDIRANDCKCFCRECTTDSKIMHLKKLEQECIKCFKVQRDPSTSEMLPCGHLLCAKDYEDQKQPNSRVLCPECKKQP